MKISSEVKVGLIGIATLVVLIWGINYLKGRDILKSNYSLHAYYEDSEGLEISSAVLMNGVKIGYIDDIRLEPAASQPIHVILHIEKAYRINRGATAVLFSADILGSKAVRIEPSVMEGYFHHNDTIPSATQTDMIASISAQVMPVMEKIGALAESLDSVVHKMDTLLESEAPDKTFQHLSEVSESLSASLKPGGSLYNSLQNLESFSTMLNSQEDEIASMTGHLNSISEALDSAGIDEIAEELKTTSVEVNKLLGQINSGEGSMGKLIYSDSLYSNLKNLVADLDSLVIDLEENPKDYVHFSLFGK
jgi:phospholipid/cholesterol/gamma-HCH transport system substrate-binding protein